MKILICMGYCLIYEIIIAVLRSLGILPGAAHFLILAVIMTCVAGITCKAYDNKRSRQESASKTQNNDGYASRTKLAQRTKAAVSAELSPFFAHREKESAKLKHTLANHVEKQILTMPTQEAMRLSASFDAGKHTQCIREQIARSCGSLAATATEDDAKVYRNVIIFLEEQTSVENAAIAAASEKASAVEQPPVDVMAAISDSEDSNYIFCPKCNTRQRSNRTRCMECGTYFSNAPTL